MPNRLAAEQSPYLLQHANNPVDWYPWGDEAFEAARDDRQADLPVDRLRDLPLVPRHGARVVRERRASRSVLNDLFVSIKVDREERPDVDRVYMTFVQATTGSGGWPMSVWLTPDCSRSSAAPTFRRRRSGAGPASSTCSRRLAAPGARIAYRW